MSEKSKLELVVGEFKFFGEGEEAWLAEQLDKILKNAEEILKLSPEKTKVEEIKSSGHDIETKNLKSQKNDVPLAKFLSQNDATTNQIKKFLGAAVWLSCYKNKTDLTTSDITSALKEAGQTRLGNPSDCLAKNVSKGVLEKHGKEFIVTVHGKEEFGVND